MVKWGKSMEYNNPWVIRNIGWTGRDVLGEVLHSRSKRKKSHRSWKTSGEYTLQQKQYGQKYRALRITEKYHLPDHTLEADGVGNKDAH